MRQLLPLTGATLLAATALAACSSAAGLTINLYISPEDHLQTVVDRCTQEAAGRYKIVYNKLPRGADGQREQMVRRLAAGDTSLDVLGLDVTWVPEFAEAGWAEEWTGRERGGGHPGRAARAAGHRQVEREAVRRHEEHERPAALVRRPDHAVAAEDVRRADGAGAAAEGRRQAVPGRVHRRAVRRPGRLLQHARRLRGRPHPVRRRQVRGDGRRRRPRAGAAEEAHDGGDHGPVADEPEGGRHPPGVPARPGGDRAELAVRLRVLREGEAAGPAALQVDAVPVGGAGPPSRVTIGGFNLAVITYSQHKPEAFEAALCLRNATSQKYQALGRRHPAEHRVDLPATTHPWTRPNRRTRRRTRRWPTSTR